MIGHNGGPSLQPGQAWRLQCWRAAREKLLPTLPIEVVRLRVKRARDLGLDYKTYASVRAASGHDVVAFLFSSNALRIMRGAEILPADRAAKLQSMDCARIGLATAPLQPKAMLANPELDAGFVAPYALATFNQARAAIRLACGQVPGDRVILVGDSRLEAEWSAAGRLAFYLPAERFFAAI